MFSKAKKDALRRSKIQPISTKIEISEKKGRPFSQVYSMPSSCAARLNQDMTALINDPQDSDVQFKVGGGDIPTLQENGEESTTVTLYAHSLILHCRSRYFTALLDEERRWGESSNIVIHKPNISPSTFQDVLHYIYTGNSRVEYSKNIMELTAAAVEMELEELSVECQNELLCRIKNILFYEDNIETGDMPEYIPINTAIRTHIIPALNLASNHSLFDLYNKLLATIIPQISKIIDHPDAYNTFIDSISSDDLARIIESDNLTMDECSVWDLALDWACHRTKLEKTAVEAHLCNPEEEEEEEEEEEYDDDDGIRISGSQLNKLKAVLAPLLPAIRFTLLKREEYTRIVHTISYFLPRRRTLELQQYFMKNDHAKGIDTPRMKNVPKGPSSKIIISYRSWEFLRKNIFETGGIAGCSSPGDLKFEPLFQASEHGFLAATFHQRCDNKGPTLVVVKSSDGHLFGGVNFSHWDNSMSSYVSSSYRLNFLFALPDEKFRKEPEIFVLKDKTHEQYSSCNNPLQGPTFGGGYDLHIANSANASQSSYSNLPYSYSASGASNTSLAGTRNFIVSNYVVFAISKK